MIRLCRQSLVVLVVLWPLHHGNTADTDDRVVIVHFGDSTCITGYLPSDQRVEAVLNDRLSDFYKHQKVVSHNVAAGGDYIRRFLDKGRYEKVVKDKIPQIDIALIRYGHNDQKHCEPVEFKRHLEEFCDADEEFKVITRLWPNALLVSDPYAGAVQISKDGVVILYLRKDEIVKDGSVVGSFDGNQVRKDGSIVGEIRGDVFRHEGADIWKLDKGNLYKGTEVRWDGSIVGDIRADGTVWWQGSRWGAVKPYEGTQQKSMRVLAALYYFSDYFQKE